MENFVVIATYSNQLEAEVAQATLAEAEIESFLKFDDTAGMLPSLQFTKGVKLRCQSTRRTECPCRTERSTDRTFRFIIFFLTLSISFPKFANSFFQDLC